MAKHGIEGDPDDYCLVQLIPGGGNHVIFALFKAFINYVYLILFYWDTNFAYHEKKKSITIS